MQRTLTIDAKDESFVVGAALGLEVAPDDAEQLERTRAPHVLAPQQAVWDALSAAAIRANN